MVMPRITHEEISAAAGAATEEGRGPTLVAAPAAASPELTVTERPRRRHFDNKEKLRVLDEIDRAASTRGAIGAIMRREGLYSSTITDWRRQREAGALAGLSSAKRGPKPMTPNPLAAEHAQLKRDNKRLQQRLDRAEAVIDIQKKVALLIGFPIEDDEKL